MAGGVEVTVCKQTCWKEERLQRLKHLWACRAALTVQLLFFPEADTAGAGAKPSKEAPADKLKL